jgi:hypothetical protein
MWTLDTQIEDIRKAAEQLATSLRTQSVAVVVTATEILEREAAKSERLRITPIKLPL